MKNIFKASGITMTVLLVSACGNNVDFTDGTWQQEEPAVDVDSSVSHDVLEEESSLDSVEAQPETEPSSSDSYFDFPEVDLNIDWDSVADDAKDWLGIFDTEYDSPDNLGSEDAWIEYDRSAFPTWRDINGSGCNARQDILARDLNNVVIDSDGCTVLSGDFYDMASAKHIDFINDGNGGGVDIDHIVPLSYAATYGNAMSWSDEKRIDFANNEINLIAMDASANRAKSDHGPSEWLPSDESYHCDYVTHFVEVAQAYGITVSDADMAVKNDVC